LFGGNALKDDDAPSSKPAGTKLGGIFDYDEDDVPPK